MRKDCRRLPAVLISDLFSVIGDRFLVPVKTLFPSSGQILEVMFVTVNIDETVAFRETGMSGDQIHERPAAVSDELHAQVHGFFNLMQMLKPETFLQ